MKLLRKILFICIVFCLFGGTVYAKNTYYKSYTDSTSGRTVEYFDLDGDNVERLYFTQSYWLKDSDAFVVSCYPESKLYKYNLAKHTVEALHGDGVKCNDVGITKDNLMYMRTTVDTDADRKLYVMDLDAEGQEEEISAEVNSSGTAFVGDLVLRRWYNPTQWTNENSYDRMIIFAGETGKSAVGGKMYSYNEEYTKCKNGAYQRWRNSWYFDVPDSFLYGNDFDTVEIEIEYYATVSGRTLTLFFNPEEVSGKTTDKICFRQAMTASKWSTAKFVISSGGSDGIEFSNGYKDEKYNVGAADFRFATEGGSSNEGCKIYVHKVTVRKTSKYKMTCLGDRPSGYQIHPSADGKFLSLTEDDKDNPKLVIYDVEKNAWEIIQKKFTSPNTVANHVMINPVYTNLVLFAHEGTASEIFDRMWVYDRKTKQFSNVFKQYNNVANTYTGEAVGHESWTADGENIVAVKYKEANNIGKSGIIRMNKYGEEREYLNDDYDYWHCAASPDGRWIVADTKLDANSKTNIVLIDSKTGKSYIIANVKAGWKDPWQPHPQFSRDGKKVTFSMIYRQVNSTDVLGVGIVDVSSLVDDGQYLDSLYQKANELQDLRISPFEVNYTGTSPKSATTQINNLDEKKKQLTFYSAVYDETGKMISLGVNGYNSSADDTITSNFNWTSNSKVLKCFLWENELKPIISFATPVKKLRAAKIGANSVVLTWQPNSNLLCSGYEIYRNGQKIGTTQDLVFRDANLSKLTEYCYEVKPIYYENVYLAENVIPSYINTVSGQSASVNVKTLSSVTTSDVSNTYQSVEWNINSSKGLTLLSGGTISTDSIYLSSSSQWLNFDVNNSYQSGSNMNMAWVDITYKDYGSSEIYLEYNTSDPTATTAQKSHKRAETVITCKNTGEIRTARIPLIDVDFSGYDGYDFRIGTSNKIYICNVNVLGY